MLRKLLTVPALAALLLLGAPSLRTQDAAPPAEGVEPPLLHDTWWKLKFVAKGYEVSLEDGQATPASFHTTAYMHVLSAEGMGVPEYVYQMFTEVAPDQWSFEYGDDVFVDGLAGNGTHAVLANTFLGFDLLTLHFGVNFTGRLIIKLDKQGLLKSGKLKTLAGELTESTLDVETNSPFHGSAKIAGALVDAGELPFVPE